HVLHWRCRRRNRTTSASAALQPQGRQLAVQSRHDQVAREAGHQRCTGRLARTTEIQSPTQRRPQGAGTKTNCGRSDARQELAAAVVCLPATRNLKESRTMTDTNQATSNEQWTSVQAYVLAVICLLVGIAGGWLIRGSQSPAAAATEAPSASAPAPAMANPGAQTPSPAEIQKVADTQAAPLIEKLKTDPNNAGLL